MMSKDWYIGNNKKSQLQWAHSDDENITTNNTATYISIKSKENSYRDSYFHHLWLHRQK
jgi:hypothetical protein